MLYNRNEQRFVAHIVHSCPQHEGNNTVEPESGVTIPTWNFRQTNFKTEILRFENFNSAIHFDQNGQNKIVTA